MKLMIIIFIIIFPSKSMARRYLSNHNLVWQGGLDRSLWLDSHSLTTSARWATLTYASCSRWDGRCADLDFPGASCMRKKERNDFGNQSCLLLVLFYTGLLNVSFSNFSEHTFLWCKQDTELLNKGRNKNTDKQYWDLFLSSLKYILLSWQCIETLREHWVEFFKSTWTDSINTHFMKET